MFLTATEWKGLGGKKADSTNKSYRPLPFDACALSLQPFEVRVCVRVCVSVRVCAANHSRYDQAVAPDGL
jgi:hypothetical protein